MLGKELRRAHGEEVDILEGKVLVQELIGRERGWIRPLSVEDKACDCREGLFMSGNNSWTVL